MTFARHRPLAPAPASGATSARGRAWPPVLGTALVWGALAMSAGYWGLRWWGEAPSRPLPPPPTAALNIDTGRVAAALGARGASDVPAAPAPVAGLNARLRLLGVVAGRDGLGAALISVDGQPAKPVRLGGVVVEGVRLLSLGARHAEVGDDAGRTRLVLPAIEATPTVAAKVIGAGVIRP